MILSIITLRIMIFRIMTLRIMTLRIMILSIMTLSIMTQEITIIMRPRIMALMGVFYVQSCAYGYYAWCRYS